MKPRKPININDKQRIYIEISKLVQQHVCLAQELKDPFADFFHLANVSKSDPLQMLNKHKAEQILQEWTETDSLLRSKIELAKEILSTEILNSLLDYLPEFKVRDVALSDLRKFLQLAIDNADKVISLIEKNQKFI